MPDRSPINLASTIALALAATASIASAARAEDLPFAAIVARPL